MLCIVASASFVENASDTYAGNLATFCREEAEVAGWLSTQWEKEELQHGAALRAYVERVWPEFDWPTAYARFFDEYSSLCGAEQYERTCGLEMVSRCVVEMGTSTFYQAMRDMAGEPVLEGLCERIRNDEVRHYKHFLQYFARFDARERNGRWDVLRALKRRVVDMRHSDAEIALWNAFRSVHPNEPREGARFRGVQKRVARLVRDHYPATQAIKMMLKPLRLPNPLASVIQPIVVPMALVARQVLLR